MSIETLPIEHVNGEPLTLEQRQYLTGYFAGVAAADTLVNVALPRTGDPEPVTRPASASVAS